MTTPQERIFVTRTGQVLTEQDIWRLAAEAEHGYDLDKLKHCARTKPNSDSLTVWVQHADNHQCRRALNAVVQRLAGLRTSDPYMRAPEVADFLEEVIGDFLGKPR